MVARDDIRRFRQSHRDAVLRARRAGYDIAYVYAAHDASLLWHFLSPAYNRRTDEYGGSFDNRLRLLRDAITPQYNAQGLGRAVNAGRAQVWGLSLADRHALGPALSLRWRADWLQARDRGDGAHAGRRLPGRPQWQAHAQLDWQRGPWALRYAFAFESGAYYDSPNLLPAPVLRSHDLLLRWSAGRWALRAEARNLGDNRHARFNGFAEPGRQVWFGLSYAHP